jgi:SAM-dependent methyltransferase
VEDESFDVAYGTDTSAIREVGSLDFAFPNALHAFRYQASSDALVRNAIAQMDIEIAEFSFIDFGSGKGRVLMVAAEYPFKQVIGVELSSELNEIANQNIARLPSDRKRAGDITTFCCDAAEFDPPFGNLVCYFYNPFDGAVVKPIADKLAAHAGAGYRTIVIYVDPRYRDLFEQTGAFQVVRYECPLLVLSA